MASKVRACESFPCTFSEQVRQINSSISSRMSIEEFQRTCGRNPGFRFEDGAKEVGANTILNQAAFAGNFSIVRYILEEVSKASIDVGDQNGYTPLLNACYAPSPYFKTTENAYETALALLQNGADPNLAAAARWEGSPKPKSVPMGATPLWVAAEITESSQLAHLLLTQGAQLGERPLSLGQAVLDRARQAQAQLVGAIAEGTDLLPPLSEMVTAYAGPQP